MSWAMASTRSRISSIPATMPSATSVPSSLALAAAWARSATSRARPAVCSAAARSSSAVAEVWLMAADCSVRLEPCSLTVARISVAAAPTPWAPPRTSVERWRRFSAMSLRWPLSSRSSGAPSAATLAVRSPPATRPAKAEYSRSRRTMAAEMRRARATMTAAMTSPIMVIRRTRAPAGRVTSATSSEASTVQPRPGSRPLPVDRW